VSETHGRYSLGKDRTYTRLLVGDVGSKEEVLVLLILSIHTPLFDRKDINGSNSEKPMKRLEQIKL